MRAMTPRLAPVLPARRHVRGWTNVTVASEHVNRTLKRAKDAAEWMPDRNTWWFAEQVAHVKRKYGPSTDPAERDAFAAFVSCEAEGALAAFRLPGSI